jgi:hypothetical protein
MSDFVRWQNEGGRNGDRVRDSSQRADVKSAVAMPFKSQAQRRKFAELLVKGEISPETFEEWNRETGSKRLPERVSRKRKAPARARKTTTARKRKASKKR